MFFIVHTFLLTVISIYSIQKMTRNNQKLGNKTEVDRRFKAKKERNQIDKQKSPRKKEKRISKKKLIDIASIDQSPYKKVDSTKNFFIYFKSFTM